METWYSVRVWGSVASSECLTEPIGQSVAERDDIIVYKMWK